MTAAVPPWVTGKQATSLIGAAGEHYCMAQLLVRGYLAALTPRGVPEADILVYDPTGGVAAELQVKSRSGVSGHGWRMSKKHEATSHGRLFYCFVDFSQEPVPVYVIPDGRVAEFVMRSHAAWLETPGRNGQQRQDWAGRFVSPNPHLSIDGFGEGWMEPYRNQWHMIMAVS